jgi:hypothetical protein
VFQRLLKSAFSEPFVCHCCNFASGLFKRPDGDFFKGFLTQILIRLPFVSRSILDLSINESDLLVEYRLKKTKNADKKLSISTEILPLGDKFVEKVFVQLTGEKVKLNFLIYFKGAIQK